MRDMKIINIFLQILYSRIYNARKDNGTSHIGRRLHNSPRNARIYRGHEPISRRRS